MKYLKSFNNTSDYELFIYDEEYVTPNVCYIEENSSLVFNGASVPQPTTHPVMCATYNATADNMLALANTDDIYSLKIDGNTIEFEPPTTNTITVKALASEITINTSNGTAIFPSNYVHDFNSLIIKPTDSSLKCSDFQYVCILLQVEGMGFMAAPFQINDAITNGIITYDETNDTLSFKNLKNLLGYSAMGCIFANFNEETQECTPIDTTCTFEVLTGGLDSPYMFETEGVHEVEIELTKSNINKKIFKDTCITSIISTNDIVSIDDEAFYYYPGLTSVNLGNGMTLIGDNAFGFCTSLTSINISKGVTSIGKDAFQNCRNLTSITIPEGVTSIGDSVFYNCSNLTSITIPEGVTSIGDSAFYNCSNLTSITIPEGVTSIGDSVFGDCSNLTSITIPDSVTSIGDYVFCDCSGLTSVNLGNGMTSIGDKAFYNCTSLASINIPDSVTLIGKEVFQDCKNLTSINIPDSVTSIGDSAFQGCKGLTEIIIPDSVTSIGDSAFYNCSKLISVNLGNGITSISKKAFGECYDLNSITIPDGVTSIGDSAFYNCNYLTSITIPDSVTSIGDSAFRSCRRLTEITIPDNVTSIGDCAFVQCQGLTKFNSIFASMDKRCLIINNKLVAFAYNRIFNYTIPEGVTSIGDYAFAYNEYLSSITIPDSVISIGEGAFMGTEFLRTINLGSGITSIDKWGFADSEFYDFYCKATTPPTILINTIFYDNSNAKIYVPMGSVDAYKTAEHWSEHANIIIGYNF